jgi:hypothetical protein
MFDVLSVMIDENHPRFNHQFLLDYYYFLCNAPRLSSGHERSPVAELVFAFKLLRWLVAQG